MIQIYNTTMHAPMEKSNVIELKKQSDYFTENEILKNALDAIDIFIIIINKYRQIVHANRAFISALGMKSLSTIIGKRPGEAVSCIHSKDHEEGCGASEACRYCNAVNLVLKAISKNTNVSNEAAITYKNGSIELPMNIFENVTPIEMHDEKFYIVTMMDVSDAKRRRLLERLFFHDIINTSGALSGLVSLLKDDVPEEIKPEIQFVEDAFKGLVDEIIEQKQILDAENNDLSVENITLYSDEIINTIAKLYKNNEESIKKNIVISANGDRIAFKSDYVLLKRVLGNMIKNAIEASKVSAKVIIGCNPVDGSTDYLEFWVWNEGYISKEAQLKILQRSFSTKGEGRGIGTYSMKLFGERYLNGKVGFESFEEVGTKFYIRLKI